MVEGLKRNFQSSCCVAKCFSEEEGQLFNGIRDVLWIVLRVSASEFFARKIAGDVFVVSARATRARIHNLSMVDL